MTRRQFPGLQMEYDIQAAGIELENDEGARIAIRRNHLEGMIDLFCRHGNPPDVVRRVKALETSLQEARGEAFQMAARIEEQQTEIDRIKPPGIVAYSGPIFWEINRRKTKGSRAVAALREVNREQAAKAKDQDNQIATLADALDVWRKRAQHAEDDRARLQCFLDGMPDKPWLTIGELTRKNDAMTRNVKELTQALAEAQHTVTTTKARLSGAKIRGDTMAAAVRLRDNQIEELRKDIEILTDSLQWTRDRLQEANQANLKHAQRSAKFSNSTDVFKRELEAERDRREDVEAALRERYEYERDIRERVEALESEVYSSNPPPITSKE